jgi:hypothetical protein
MGMNPYIICNPYRFTTGAPTPNSKPPVIDWGALQDVQEKILNEAAETHKFESVVLCPHPLGEQYPHVFCLQTMIFQRKRKAIEDPRGELTVTITRSVSEWHLDAIHKHVKLTDEQRTFCKTELNYSQTWCNVEKIHLEIDYSSDQLPTRSADRIYQTMYCISFGVRKAKAKVWVFPPTWVKWSKNTETQAQHILENKLYLTRSVPKTMYSTNSVPEHDDEDILYSI